MLEEYKNKSMVDVAYMIVKETVNPILFKDLYKELVSKLELSEEEANAKIASFYTNLTLDGRFVDLKNTLWDLRERQTYDKVHIDINDVYSDIDEETDANTDLEELDETEKEELGVGDDDDVGDDDVSNKEEA